MKSKSLKEKVNYLHISPQEEKPEMEAIYWHHTITALNDHRFHCYKHIDSRKLWKKTKEIDWWKPFDSVEKLMIIGDIPSYDFIKQFKNLSNLSIIGSKTFNDLRVIEELLKLEFLQIISCHQVSDIAPIIRLRNKQKEQIDKDKSKRESEDADSLQSFIFFNGLSNINLTDCNISTLEPFTEDKELKMDELHLRYNHIKDITPLGVMSYAFLDLSHNHIGSIDSLFASEAVNYYGINLRHNLISDISSIKTNEVEIPCKIKLWMGHNNIPSQQLNKLRDNHYIWLMDK